MGGNYFGSGIEDNMYSSLFLLVQCAFAIKELSRRLVTFYMVKRLIHTNGQKNRQKSLRKNFTIISINDQVNNKASVLQRK